MAEILHHLDQSIGSLSHYLHGFIHARWCRISAINSRTLFFLDVLISALFFSGGKTQVRKSGSWGIKLSVVQTFDDGSLPNHLFVCWGESAKFAGGVFFWIYPQKNTRMHQDDG